MTSRVFVVVFPPPNSQFSFQFFFLFPSKRTRYFHRFYRDNKILYETAGPLCLGTHRAAVMCCWFCRITSLTEAIVAEEGQRLELRGARWKVEVSHIWMMNDCVWIKIRPTFLLFFRLLVVSNNARFYPSSSSLGVVVGMSGCQCHRLTKFS